MTRLLKYLGFGAFALIVVLLARYAGVLEFGNEAPQVKDDAQAPWQGPMLPAVTLQTLQGEHFNLSEMRGKVLLINFWASWCAPCLEEFPLLFDLVHDFDGELILVAISQDAHHADAVQFLKRFEATHGAVLTSGYVITAWDASLEIAQKTFHVVRLPETLIVNRTGRIVRKVVGVQTWKDAEVGTYLRTL